MTSSQSEVQGPLQQAVKRLGDPIFLGVVAAYVALLAASWAAIVTLIPDTVSTHLLGRSITVDGVHQRLLAKGAFVAVLAPAVFIVEFVCVGWAECSVRQLVTRWTPSSRSDLVSFLGGFMPGMGLLSAILTLGVVLVSADWLRERIHEVAGVSPTVAGAPLLAQVAGLFLFYTLFDYWSHRLDHTPAFWPLHRYHHAADDFFIVTAGRTHPAVFTAVIGATLPGALVGASVDALLTLALFILALRLLIHSRIRSDFGWVGRYVLQSPLHHRMHHHLHQQGQATHLGLCPLWDRLFGTWDGRVAASPIPIGVTDAPYRHGAWIVPDLVRDYRAFWAGVGAFGIRAPAPAVRLEGPSR